MLTIQSGVANNFSRIPAFSRRESHNYAEDAEYVDYEDITNREYPADSFDYNKEKEDARQELDLWEQTKANLDSITRATDKVPLVKKGTSILSGLTMVAIGWGGLRWGTVGTLEVLSKIGKSGIVTSIKGAASNAGKFAAEKFGSLNKIIAETDTYKAAEKKASDLNTSFLNSPVGKKYTGIKTSIKDNSLYQGAVKFENNTVDYLKKLNYKRVFVETMGIAGGGTAAVNALGGKAIDGTKQNVEVDEQGNYTVNGEYYDVA